VPLGHEVFAGNVHDSSTAKSVVESLERKHGTLSRIWLMDRGMASNDNLEFLRERGAACIVGTTKAILRQFERHPTEQKVVIGQEGVDVKLVPDPDGWETFLLARSVEGRSKDRAMHEKFIARMHTAAQAENAARSGLCNRGLYRPRGTRGACIVSLYLHRAAGIRQALRDVSQLRRDPRLPDAAGSSGILR